MNILSRFNSCFRGKKPIIAMIHVDALPGTPKNQFSPKEIIAKAVSEAKIYYEAGITSLAIENMHDVPYLKASVGHEISSLMSIIGYEIKKQTQLVCGIQILAGANKEALSAAHSASLDFIRAEGFVFGHVADEGYIDSQAAELLRFRKQIGAENIMIFTDIKKKHSSHTITADTSIDDHAHAAGFFLSDALVITGKSTGLETDKKDLINAKNACQLPVLIGSGINATNFQDYYPLADGFIVGSYFKKDGNWQNPPDTERITALLRAKKQLLGN